jgi:hypothetical protein
MSSSNKFNPSSSLTAPWDRDAEPVALEPATRDELLNDAFVQKFTRVDRFFSDPVYNNQVYSLVSFVPTKGATPDKEGVYGFVKVRGSFSTPVEANGRAEYIIREIDAYHQIHTVYTGKPFPLCMNTKKYVAETVEIDIKKKATETISEDIRQKRSDEKKEMEDIKVREEALLKESKDDYEPEPLEKYTTLRVKKANLVWTYLKTQEKLVEMRKSIKTTYKELSEMDAQDSHFKELYFDKYMEARKQVNLPTEQVEDNFLKYLVEDAELDFDLE